MPDPHFPRKGGRPHYFANIRVQRRLTDLSAYKLVDIISLDNLFDAQRKLV